VNKEKIILAPKRCQEKYIKQKQRIYAVFCNKKHRKYREEVRNLTREYKR
jgi:hypothetical protein